MIWSSLELSRRESEILKLIAFEYSNREIANKLYISCETVNSHRKSILKKLQVKNTAGMIRVAFEKNILPVSWNQIQMQIQLNN